MIENPNIGLRISELVDHFTNGVNTKFAELIGTSEANIRNYRNGKMPKFDFIYNVCSKLEINYEWLITGKGTMLKEEETKEIPSLATVKKEKRGYPAINDADSLNNVAEPNISIYKLQTDYYGTGKQHIPLYEIEASAGLTTLFSNQNSQIPLDYIDVPNSPNCDGAIYVRGDSMYPILKSGDIVCYKTIYDFENIYFGEMYLLAIDVEGDQYLTFKYIQKSEKGQDYIRLVSQNDHHAPKDILKSNIKAVALVKLSIRYNTIS